MDDFEDWDEDWELIDEDYYDEMMDIYFCNGNCRSCFEWVCPFY